MQLKRRIKKIEERLILNNPESKFCDCYEKFWQSELREKSDARENGREADYSKLHPLPDFEKGFCERCKKPISSNDIEFAKRMIKIYGNEEH
jgi:hypothetical protein